MSTSADDLVTAAQERTGLGDLGPDTWQAGLHILITELESDASVTEDGKKRMFGEFTDALANRLRVIDYSARHPELREQPTERPMVILGMPRTGTTVASCLLDQDPKYRSLLNWEALDSVPPPTTETLRTDHRCLTKLKTQQDNMEVLRAFDIAPPHWEWADGPTECIFLHGQDFKAFYWDAMMPTPAYSDWLLDTNMISAYEYEKTVLQILQSQAPGRWSLKMPSHAVHIETLLDVFPDARLVWAHRDPYAVLGSLCSTQKLAKGSVSTNVDPEYIGRHSVTQLRAHIDRATATRDRIGDHRFFDLHYADLMNDPIATMERLYAWDGEELTADVEKRMRHWIVENPQDKHGRHSYTLAEYGQSVEAVQPYFADYIERYAVVVDGA